MYTRGSGFPEVHEILLDIVKKVCKIANEWKVEESFSFANPF